MALHQSEVIMYAQMDGQLRLRVRALIAKRNVENGLEPNPEKDLDRIMWQIAVDPEVLTYLDGAVDQAEVAAKIAAAPDANLQAVIDRVLGAPDLI